MNQRHIELTFDKQFQAGLSSGDLSALFFLIELLLIASPKSNHNLIKKKVFCVIKLNIHKHLL